jgi:hypothetical protein
MLSRDSAASSWRPRLRPALARWHGRLPPARLTWLILAGLAGYGVWFFAGLGLESLLALPVAAAGLDLLFQRLRFPSVRFPDSALATGLFLALILPPSVLLVYGLSAVLAALGMKHLLRFRGRPLVNPAAGGVVVGVLLYGLFPAWWVALDLPSELAMVVLGAFLLLWTRSTWRIAPTFLLIFAPFSLVLKLIFAAALAPKILLLTLVDPGTLFFALYMVTEPRTAPANPRLHYLYAALVAFGAVFLPVVMPSIGVLVALVLVGLGAGLVRAALTLRPAPVPTRGSERGGRRGSRGARSLAALRSPSRAASTWGVGQRVAVGLMLLFLVGAVTQLAPVSPGTPSVFVPLPSQSGGSAPVLPGPGSNSGAGTAAQCQNDNPSIPSSTLSSLHHVLGPSVILSFNANTGQTVFYDPVNQVTVTETNLYEDYGYAEFNGDDFAVAGCAP